jgi:hypothetical protein
MENAIFNMVIKSDDTARAALAISSAADFGNKAREAFKGPIAGLVSEKWHDGAEYLEEELGWHEIWLPIKKGNYEFHINYLWDKAYITMAPDADDISPEEKNILYEKMSDAFGLRPKPNAAYIWYSEGLSWPSFVKDELYTFHLCKLYTEHPQEAADKIISIALSFVFPVH